MRFLRQSLAGVFLAAVTAGLLFYAGTLIFGAVQDRMSGGRQAPPARERVFAVSLVTAEMGSETPELVAFGRADSRRRLELRVPVAGQVIYLAQDFVEGGTVEPGELLVRLDPADAEAALRRTEADLLDARADASEAGRALGLAADELQAAEDQAALRVRALQRQLDLQERGVGTAAAVETAELSAAQARQTVISRQQAQSQAEARVDQAAAKLARAEIEVGIARRDLEDTEVYAPFAGTLQSVSLVEGRRVSANERLAELVDPAELEVAFRISTVQYARLLDENGRLLPLPVTVSLDAAGSNLTAAGVISRDSGAAGEGQTGRLVYARLDPAPGFKPDDFLTVRVKEPQVERVARVPASALDASGTVLLLGAEDRLEALEVQLVRRQGDDVLLRARGLNGREVVVARTPLLGAGIRVRPLRTDENGRIAAPAAPAVVALTKERRAKLVAFVEANQRMPAEAKERVLGQLKLEEVPAQLVTRLESRMGG
jgi:multidrug efflux pump subunit AcrA (membrane-fusion protein)